MPAELRLVDRTGQRRQGTADADQWDATQHLGSPFSSRVDLLGMALLLNSTSIAALVLGTGAINQDATSNPSWWTYIPASFSAVGTVAAFAVTYRLFRRGSQEKIREQAEQVFIKEERETLQDGCLSIKITVFNKSSGPIWRVEVKPLRSGKTYANDGVLQLYQDVWPQDSLTYKWMVAKENAPSEDRHPQLTFTDASQRRWRRIGSDLKLIDDQSK